MLPHWDGQYIHIKSQRPAHQEPVRMHCTVTRASHDSGVPIRTQPILRSPQLPGPLMGSWHPVWGGPNTGTKIKFKVCSYKEPGGRCHCFLTVKVDRGPRNEYACSGVHGCSWFHLDHAGSWFSPCGPRPHRSTLGHHGAVAA